MIPIAWSVARRRLLLIGRLTPGMALLELTVRIGHLMVLTLGLVLDAIFVPSWRATAVYRPVFIVGHQRSGTTVIHRSLGASPDAVGPNLNWLLFPSITIHRVGRAVFGLDRWCGGPVARVLLRLQDRAFGFLDPIHVSRLGLLEEDEFVYWATFGTTMVETDHPAVLGALRARREVLPERTRRQLMDWYEQSVRKRVTLDAGRYVGKNPAATSEIRLLRERFPDATFVSIWRDPEAAFASRCKLIDAIWERRGLAPMREHHVEALRVDSRATVSALEAIEPSASIRVDFEAIQRDVYQVVEHLFGELDLREPDPNTAAIGPR